MGTTDLPKLPATRDPFELLDVSPSCDERTLKQAYVRLLRTYRPERAPAEFQRIRSAYESALSQLQNASNNSEWETTWEDYDSGPDTYDDDDSDSESNDLEENSQRAHNHRKESVEITLEEHTFVQALGSDWTTLAEDRFLPWPELRKEVQSVYWAKLFEKRLTSLALQDRFDVLLVDIESNEFLRDILEVPALVPLALRALCGATWAYPKKSAELYSLLYSHPQDDDDPIEASNNAYLVAELVSQEYRALLTSHFVPRVLHQVITLHSVINDAEFGPLVSELHQKLIAEAKAFGRIITTITENYEDLTNYLKSLCDDYLTESIEFTDLRPAQQAAMERAISAADQSPWETQRFEKVENSILAFILLFGLVVVVNIFQSHGLVWGLVSIVLWPVALLATTVTFELIRPGTQYTRIIQPRLTQIIVQLKCSPSQLLSAIQLPGKEYERLEDFCEDIQDDPTLAIIYKLTVWAHHYNT